MAGNPSGAAQPRLEAMGRRHVSLPFNAELGPVAMGARVPAATANADPEIPRLSSPIEHTPAVDSEGLLLYDLWGTFRGLGGWEGRGEGRRGSAWDMKAAGNVVLCDFCLNRSK